MRNIRSRPTIQTTIPPPPPDRHVNDRVNKHNIPTSADQILHWPLSSNWLIDSVFPDTIIICWAIRLRWPPSMTWRRDPSQDTLHSHDMVAWSVSHHHSAQETELNRFYLDFTCCYSQSPSVAADTSESCIGMPELRNFIYILYSMSYYKLIQSSTGSAWLTSGMKTRTGKTGQECLMGITRDLHHVGDMICMNNDVKVVWN